MNLVYNPEKISELCKIVTINFILGFETAHIVYFYRKFDQERYFKDLLPV